jgi:hypothetical protein
MCETLKVGETDEMRFQVLIALMMEAESTSETSENFYQITRRNNPEYSHIQIKLLLYVERDEKTM